LVEHRSVAPRVAGSIPVTHPRFSNRLCSRREAAATWLQRCFWGRGAAAGQSFVGGLVQLLRVHFKADDDPVLNRPENKWPQRIIGLIESIAYPWLMFAADPKAAVALVAAWLTAKSVGNWSGWQSVDPDRHLGRRRLYVYLIANAFQLAWSAAIATALHLVREQ
jgi:hypothetical protein